MSLERLRAGLLMALVLASLASLAVVQPYGARFALAGLAAVGLAQYRAAIAPKREAWKVATAVVLICAVVAPLLLKVDWLDAVTALVLYLLVHRVRTGRGARDGRFSLLFSVMLQLIALHRSEHIALAVVLALQVAMLPGALSLVHLQELRERNRYVAGPLRQLWPLLVLLGGLTGVSTALLFVLIPRVDAQVLAQLGQGQELSGFSEQVELGELGEIKDNPSVVMRVRVSDERGEPQLQSYYFRGLALTHFDGRRWTVAGGREGFHGGDNGPPEDLRGLLRQEITLEPLEQAPIFGIPTVVSVVTQEPLSVEPSGDLRFRGAEVPRHYVLYSDPQRGNTEAGDLRAALQLPELDPRISALADEIAAGTLGSWDTAAALEQHLRGQYDYTLVPTQDTQGQPLSTFLFESKRGHCEYFATALAVMLRSQEIPARVVNGFYGGEVNGIGAFITVRQSHAHSWVEAWLGGAWVRLDATPASSGLQTPGLVGQLAQAAQERWRRGMLGYDFEQQMQWSRAIGARVMGGVRQAEAPTSSLWGGGLVLLSCVLGGLALLRLMRGLTQQRAAPVDAMGKLQERANRLVYKRGWRVPEALPPLEAARWLVSRAGAQAEPLVRLAWLLYGVRYGGEQAGPALRDGEAALLDLQALRGPSQGLEKGTETALVQT